MRWQSWLLHLRKPLHFVRFAIVQTPAALIRRVYPATAGHNLVAAKQDAAVFWGLVNLFPFDHLRAFMTSSNGRGSEASSSVAPKYVLRQ